MCQIWRMRSMVSLKHVSNGLQQNSQNIFLKIIPSPAGSGHRKFVQSFWRAIIYWLEETYTESFKSLYAF